ncbi:hypothetical protein GCM10027262_77630 [Nocardia tengchongensis]
MATASDPATSTDMNEIERWVGDAPYGIRWSPARQQFIARTDRYPGGLSYGADWPGTAVRGLQEIIRQRLVAGSNRPSRRHRSTATHAFRSIAAPPTNACLCHFGSAAVSGHAAYRASRTGPRSQWVNAPRIEWMEQARLRRLGKRDS